MSGLDVHLVHEYANALKFYVANSSKQKSIYTKIKTRMDRLTNLFLDGDIDKNTYEEKHKDIIREIENHTNADDKFSELLINLVELASGALETFKGSNIEKKRKLLNLVFSNLKLNGQK